MISFTKKLTWDDLKYAKIGERYWRVSRRDIPDELGYKKILESYIENIDDYHERGVGLLFQGDYGTGKTSAGCIILKAALSKMYKCLFFPVRDIQERIINNTLFDEETNASYMERAREVNFLLLDDLGDESKGKSDFLISAIEGLLRYRSDNKLPTLITTNFDVGKIKERYGVSTFEVIRASVMPCIVKGKNWREDEKNGILKGFYNG